MSEIGPTTIWPKPIDRKKISRLICTAAVPACRSSPIEGRAGRYISMAKGPIADNKPSTTAMRRNLGLMTGFLSDLVDAEVRRLPKDVPSLGNPTSKSEFIRLSGADSLYCVHRFRQPCQIRQSPLHRCLRS